ncbi:MAG: hypothetical protein ABIP11_04170 [Luteimonas sp.]
MTAVIDAVPPLVRRSRWVAAALLTVGSFGFAAAWVLVAFARDRQCSWMAILAALDAVFLLRMAKMPPGWPRAALAVAATAFTIALSNWGIVAAQIGRSMGLLPWESLTKLGPFYAWTLANLANPPLDLFWLATSLVLAAVASR